MKVLLLGASGFLGHNVLRCLIEGGHQVRVLVRRPDAIQLSCIEWQTVVGSMLDYNTLSCAAEGCDAIINCAGVTDMSLLRREDYLGVNGGLCALLVRVLEYHGISRLVHVSTVNTIGYGTVEHPANEEKPMCAPFTESYYADTKMAGEKILSNAVRQHPEWHVVIINPGYMIGPMDIKPSSGRMLLMAYRKPVMFSPSGGKTFVDVRDVAQAVVRALNQGAHGTRYIVVNRQGCFPIKELFRMQARVMGYRQCVVVIPNWLLAFAGKIGDLLRRCHIHTELSTRNVRQLMVHEYYDNSHAIKDLKINESPIEQAIADFYHWREKKQ